MFIRVKRSVHDGATYEYLQVVRSYREGPKVRQQVLATLGRRETLVASGQLDGLIRSLAKFSERLRVVEVARRSGLAAHTAKAWGPALVFGRLWERQGLPAILKALAAQRKFGFDVERAAFAMALQRLVTPGSDLQGAGWLPTVQAPGFEDLALQHLYRTTGFLAEVRDDLPQFVLCVVVNDEGWPLAWEIFPGNTADQKVFRKVVQVLRERFSIRRAVVVADRGMMSKANRHLLTEDAEQPFDYVLGCHLRREKEEAARDAAAREALLAKPETTLAHQGPKALVGNRGYARFLKVNKESVSLDRQAVEREARLDGLFVLTSNTDLSTTEVARTYKSLGRVERTFREEKSTLEIRPIYHHRDDTSMGHIVASFLALRLEVDLERRLDERAVAVSWPDLMRDLGQVQAVEVELDGERYRLRTDLGGSASAAFAAVGLRPPSAVTPLGAVP